MVTQLELKGHKGMGKKIAFIGSSGGNLYKQGGNNLPAMMRTDKGSRHGDHICTVCTGIRQSG